MTSEMFVMPTYARFPVTLVRGSGSLVWDEDGVEYLDFTGGLGALILGHAHPAWVAAVTQAAGTLGLVSNLYTTNPQAELAERLAGLLPIPDARVFFCNSGAEANEALLKLVRRWGLPQGKTQIVALDGSFHGRTIGALAATGQPSKRTAFEPLVDWFRFVEPGDLEALERALTPGDVAGVLVEPVMGEGGVHPLSRGYLRGVRALCDASGALFAVDEVQSGMGRCGAWLAVTDADVIPDIASIAKALGGGFPIGALVSRADLAFGPGDHASTFGGGPLAASAALAVIDVIEQDGLLTRAVELGSYLSEAVLSTAPAGALAAVRGRGCLLGFQLAAGTDAGAVASAALRAGVLCSTAGPEVVRMSPPLTATTAECDRAAQGLTAALEAVRGSAAAQEVSA
ncbi:MAG: acetylornithine/N-succinyldiaminopimelate aminotransferase [Actinomycetota bacterium]|jgi:acetylornithine aminotransferase|nr:acetylornithine/N-succinyldiaminopimelate aminotransferase [Actinomycetota bacterium]